MEIFVDSAVAEREVADHTNVLGFKPNIITEDDIEIAFIREKEIQKKGKL